MSELLPCPFCGGNAEILNFGEGDGDNAGGSCIACTRCNASGNVEFGRKENFVSNWNRRAHYHHWVQAIADWRAIPLNFQPETLIAKTAVEWIERRATALAAEDGK